MRMLHICDLQVGAENGRERTKEEIEDRRRYFRELIAGLKNISERYAIDYILISGDIAYTASGEEYEKAADWLHKLSAACNIPMRQIYLCPGDRDMDREEGSFKEYEDFCHKIGAPVYALAGEENYLAGIATNKDMNVICLNTPWLVQNISLGFAFIKLIKCEKKYANGLPTVILMHHSYFMENEKEDCGRKVIRNICSELCSIADMVLMGHSHKAADRYRYEDHTYLCANGAAYKDNRYYHNFHIYELGDRSEGGVDCVRTVYEYKDKGWRKRSENIKIAIGDKRKPKKEKPFRHSFSVIWWTRLES